MNFSGKSMDMKNNKFFLGAVVLGTLTFSAIGSAYAKDKAPEVTLEPPPAMKTLQRIEASNEGEDFAEGTMPIDIRRDAVIEAVYHLARVAALLCVLSKSTKNLSVKQAQWTKFITLEACWLQRLLAC